MISSEWFPIVKRTAQHGLDEASFSQDKFYFWLAIWALDVVGESVEFMNAVPPGDKTEAGDVLFGIAASSMLLGITQEDITENFTESCGDLVDSAASYADHAKKVARDQRLLSNELPKLKVLLIDVFSCLASMIDLNQALEAVNRKLQQRYPNGYTANASINRVV